MCLKDKKKLKAVVFNVKVENNMSYLLFEMLRNQTKIYIQLNNLWLSNLIAEDT